MYVPAHFRENETARLHAVMRRYPLAALVSAGPGGLVANHVPMLAVPAPDGTLTLHCHVARANAQWREIDAREDVLAIFSGPDAYVSPSVYATKRETGKVVPTWNYVAVHASGKARTFDDPAKLHALVDRLTQIHEAQRAAPQWEVSDAPPDYVAGQLRAIVGIEIAVERLTGKWKMSQNRSDADRAGTLADLAASSEAGARAAADVMATLEEH